MDLSLRSTLPCGNKYHSLPFTDGESTSHNTIQRGHSRANDIWRSFSHLYLGIVYRHDSAPSEILVSSATVQSSPKRTFFLPAPRPLPSRVSSAWSIPIMSRISASTSRFWFSSVTSAAAFIVSAKLKPT